MIDGPITKAAYDRADREAGPGPENDKTRCWLAQQYHRANSNKLEAMANELGQQLQAAITELEASGYCSDHPSLNKKNATLSKLQLMNAELSA